MSTLIQEWQQTRESSPHLRLRAIPVDSDWQLAGQPSPSISRHYFDLVDFSLSKSLFANGALQLFEFYRQHPYTFQCSGWVKNALGALCLGDARAAATFLKRYWRH